ncbi:MAG: type II toxin-antitoxin system RelE/ParE family toxin [Deltaproteobacteria bacterium]|nr:type II toxin-antitoxin system RelE/ParE family toxin [Deltaproteobacteria bacterium]
MPFDLRIDRRVIKELAGLEAKIFRQVALRIFQLSQDPRPHDSEEIRGYHDPKVPGRKGFRVDQGEYRILYTIDTKEKVVTVFRVGHRREVYR